MLAYYREAGARGRVAREAWEREQRALHDREPGLADEFDACLAGRGLAGWEAKLPTWSPGGDEVPTRRGVGQGVERDRRRGTRPARRWCRPERQHRDVARRGRGDQHARLPRTPAPLRYPRARDGLDHERHVGQRHRSGGGHVLRVQRLHARRGPARRALPLQDRVRVDPRLRRRGRGRPHPPAGRAADVAAPHARAPRDPPRGRQRDRAGLARAHRRHRPHRDRARSPGGAGAGRHRGAQPRRSAARRVRARRRGRPRARPRLRRHRFRGVGVRRRARGVGRRRRVRAGRVVPVVGPVRRAARTTTATPCSRRVCRGSPSKPA